MTNTQRLKIPIRAWLAKYSEQRLADLLCHARDGKLSFLSCCCLKGSLTATHALKEKVLDFSNELHYRQACEIAGGSEAASSYYCLAPRSLPLDSADKVRRRILIPMIRAEMRRRDRARSAETELAETLTLARQ